MIRRAMTNILKRDAALYPVITLLGPRQAGKTTLARECFPEYGYVNLEDPPIRELAANDVRKFFALHPAPLIIDEIQRVPSLASSVQVLVDSHRDDMGAFILTGSHQPKVAEAVSQSLAGRTSIHTLMPLSINELLVSGIQLSTDELLFRGFMPDVHVRGIPPSSYYRNYFQTYVERDLRQMVNIKNLNLFERFVTLLAGRIGQVVNCSSLAGETGVSATTIGEWLSILEAAFLVFRLPPHFSNISKRIVKSPKVYFTDVGLAAWLLGLESPQQISRDPLRGQLFENMVVADVRKQMLNLGRDARLSFLRTDKDFEVDLIISKGGKIQPVEIKSAMTYHRSLERNLRTLMKSDSNAENPVLIYDGKEDMPPADTDDVGICNFRRFRYATV
ncbi:MAG: ATP-binding protein [Kiritimatiellae bacterium]|nr:ATP-binding protein [Kiritimatiellia bacterium]